MKNFVVYKSSAGSGKTFTLVLEYLYLALKDKQQLKNNFKKILAITFTNKASAEMKNRIIEALNKIIHSQAEEIISKILLEKISISNEELKQRAKILLTQILHHYSDFAIGTIDSFTHRIVKTFASDLQLPNNFNVELDFDSFLNRVIATLFSQIEEDKYIEYLLKEFCNKHASNNESWDPEKQLQSFVKLLNKENSPEYINQLNHLNEKELFEIKNELLKNCEEFEIKIKSVAEQAIQLIERYHLKDDDFTFKSAGPQNFFYKCLELDLDLTTINGSRLAAAVNEGKWWGKNKLPAYEIVEPKLTEFANQLLFFLKENFHQYKLNKMLSDKMYALMLIKKIEEIILNIKQEENIVFISEFNQKIFELISNQPAPFIYERLGERYNHFLIDEFQDTSTLQWLNLIPLVENSLASAHQNLIVGDGKQSIYRWRNANVNQFANLPKIESSGYGMNIESVQQTLERNYSENILNTNYRSQRKIVEFNNLFFEYTSQKYLNDDNKNIYKNHQQISKNTSSENEGYVAVKIFEHEKQDRNEIYLKELDTVLQNIISKGYSYSDICILVRKNYQGSLIAEHLSKQSIQVISSDSLLLKNNLEVNTLIACLNYLQQETNVISASCVLNYLRTNGIISEIEFHKSICLLGEKKSLHQILLKHQINFPESGSHLENTVDLVLSLIETLKMNQQNNLYLRFFMDEILSFLNQNESSINEFLNWWETRKRNASIIIPSGSNAVNVMTIHSSKGLEFPIVIVPFADWSLYKNDEHFVKLNNQTSKLPVAVLNHTNALIEVGLANELKAEQQNQKLDNLNLLYVAFTRAVNQLYIISMKPGKAGESVFSILNDFVLSNGSQSNLYEAGNAHFNLAKVNVKPPTTFKLQGLQLNSSTKHIKIKTKFSAQNKFEQATQRGILFHQILSEINSKSQIDSVVNNAIKSGLLSVVESTSIKSKIKSIVHHPQLQKYFLNTNNTFLEKEILTQQGEVLRPDRIVVDENEITVLDYKTGKKNIKKHSEQLNTYSEALIDMGYSSVKKILVYLDELEIHELN